MVAPKLPAATNVRAQALAAATRLFAAQGVDGTAIQEIADAVGVTKPAVLHHFPSKEPLRDARARVDARALAGARCRASSPPPPRARSASTPSSARSDASSATTPTARASSLRETLDRPVEMREHPAAARCAPWLGVIAALHPRRRRSDGRHARRRRPEAYVVHMSICVVGTSPTGITSQALARARQRSASPRGRDALRSRASLRDAQARRAHPALHAQE